MKKLYKIKFIKEFDKKKIGEIANCSKKNEGSNIKNGYAEYIEEPKKKIVKKEIIKPIKIPERIQGFNFVLIDPKGGGKKPIGLGWQKKIIRFDNEKLLKHLEDGENYGVQSNNSSAIIDGQTYFLVIVDFDTKEAQDKVIDMFPETLTTSSGSPKNCCHLWLASDNNKSFKTKNENSDTLAELLGAGNQVIAPGSKHKSGSTYSIVKDIPIAFMPYAEIEAILRPLDKSPKKIKKIKKNFVPKGISNDINSQIFDNVSMENILQELGIDTSQNPTGCYFHSSTGGKCMGWDNETAHCFHCDNSWNKFSLIREAKNLTDKDTFDWFAEKAGMTEELKKSRQEYNKKKKETNESQSKEGYEVMSRRGQIERFWKAHPFYYDRSKIFWLWDVDNFKWEISDEIDFCNKIFEVLHIDTLDNKDRSEIIAGFKQVGRKHKPQPKKKSWVQYKDKIYDIKTGEIFVASPKYFVLNPIPWKIGESEDTPMIDKLFDDWIKGQDKNWKDTLYEIIAYNTSTDKFMQRIIALVGGGSNGKGTFIKLNYKFLGEENCVSSEIKDLSENHFEPAVLFGKLLCVMGEVSYDDLKNTNQLKKLGGEDKISFQFKGKTPFTDDNTATCICQTNSMPITPDKTQGFYRRWLIVDFTNQFKAIDKSLINTIPDVEFENLAKKSLRILKELYDKPHFTNEGDFDERAKRYEERSNPVIRFIEDRCNESPGNMITIREFTNNCNAYLKKNHLRVLNSHQIGKILRDEGFIVGNRKIEDISAVVIINLDLKNKFFEEKEK